jgi:hypothetical protein
MFRLANFLCSDPVPREKIGGVRAAFFQSVVFQPRLNKLYSHSFMPDHDGLKVAL